MVHRQSDLIEVKKAPGKGRGVFARRAIEKGTIIERVPIILLPVAEVYGYNIDSVLAKYVFNWEDGTVMIALGYGSLYNHSYRPNATYYNNGRRTQTYEALRDIAAGEEITVNYNGKPKSRKEMAFDVLES